MAVNLDRTIDSLLVLRAASAVAVTVTGVESANVDLGPGYHTLDVFVDVTTCNFATSDPEEHYLIHLLGSHTSNFAGETVVLATLELGSQPGLGQGSYDRGVGEYVLPCTNIGKGVGGKDVNYRYVKIGYVISGLEPSLDFNAWLAKRT